MCVLVEAETLRIREKLICGDVGASGFGRGRAVFRDLLPVRKAFTED